MSKSIGDQVWAEMTEGQKVEAVFAGHATLKQMSEGLLDGSDQLRKACREYLAETSASFENLPTDPPNQLAPDGPVQAQDHASDHTSSESLPRRIDKSRVPHETLKQRFGLPEGFVPRLLPNFRLCGKPLRDCCSCWRCCKPVAIGRDASWRPGSR